MLGDLCVIHFISSEGRGVQEEVEKGEKALEVMEERGGNESTSLGVIHGRLPPSETASLPLTMIST